MVRWGEDKKINRIVVKIGTSTLTKEDGSLDVEYVEDAARQISTLLKEGKEVIVVSSGAIGLGVKELGLKGLPRDIPMRQGAAAVGQSILIEAWREAFKKYGFKVAQLLLTYESFSNRRTYLNLRNSMSVLMKLKVVPIVNENDPISIDEIEATFGDNDKLSALVASKVNADLLVILTDVDGLYDKNPRHKDARLIPVVEEITPEIERIGGRHGSWRTKGGMRTKIEAAKIAMKSNCDMVIANAKKKDVILRIVEGEEIGTLFKASKEGYRNRDRWIRFSLCNGKVEIDEGAKEALLKGGSLLPSGIIGVEGNFQAGDIVSIVCNGEEIARGIVEYSSEEIRKIKGRHSHEIEKILGYKNYDNVIRSVNMVLI